MSDEPTNLPSAVVEPVRPVRWVWLIPLAAAIFAASLVAHYVVKRGLVVTVRMSHGYGIKAGDVVRARGIVIGVVEEIKLTPDLASVAAYVRLDPSAKNIARAGTKFWVVRPKVSFEGVGGLETIAGPRYLAALPGEGETKKEFDALPDPPVVEIAEQGSLELTLTADRRGSLKPGSPVLYRQVTIGTVLAVGLSPDRAAVEVKAYIRPEHALLIRDNSRFWNASGVGIEAGFRGFRLDLESLQSLVEGGIAVATPDKPGEQVKTGHAFPLADKAENDWLTWRPAIAP